MSQTILEKLLNGAEVEWKTLGEIAEIGTGSSNREDEKEGGQYPLYVRSKFILRSDNYEFDETAIIIPGEGGIGDIFHYVQGKYALHQRAYRIHLHSKDINSKFIYYFICGNFKKYVSKKLVGSTSLSIRKPMLQNFLVPIPKLSVQKEIVGILDAFTAHTAELTAELNERKKQYNYYLNKLLTFSDDEVEWKKLGDITQTTKNIKWKNNNQHYLYIDLTSVDRENNVVARTVEISATNAPSRAQKIVEKDDVIFATTRPTLQRYTIIDDKYSGQIASSGYCVLRAKYKNVLPKWIYYNIASNMFLTYVEANQSGSAYPSISDAKVKEFILPIPSIKTQKRIASILDKFDALTTSISEGLPREIELRNKQYEYYRDQLLNFPKPENDAIKHNSTNR